MYCLSTLRAKSKHFGENNNLIKDILDRDYGYLIQRGYPIKADKDLIKTNKKLHTEESKTRLITMRSQPNYIEVLLL